MPVPERLSRYSHADRRSLLTEPPAPQPHNDATADGRYLHLPEEALPPDMQAKYAYEEQQQPPVLRAEPAPAASLQPQPEPKSVRLKPAPHPIQTDESRRAELKARRAAMRAKAVSALYTGARTVRHNLRRSELEKTYTKSLIFLHSHLLDRKVERLFFRPTAQPLPAAAAEEPVVVSAVPPLYDGPVPRLVFDWVMTALPADLKGFAFVDFRAQRGRAMMLAARRNFEKIIGYEYDDALFDDLQMNVAQFPRSLMACRNIECLRGDRDGLAIPNQPAVLYFANAFRERFLSLIMSHAATSYRLNPRRLYVILENVQGDMGTGQDDIFYKITPPAREKLALKFFSPIKVEIYRSLV